MNVFGLIIEYVFLAIGLIWLIKMKHFRWKEIHSKLIITLAMARITAIDRFYVDNIISHINSFIPCICSISGWQWWWNITKIHTHKIFIQRRNVHNLFHRSI